MSRSTSCKFMFILEQKNREGYQPSLTGHFSELFVAGVTIGIGVLAGPGSGKGNASHESHGQQSNSNILHSGHPPVGG